MAVKSVYMMTDLEGVAGVDDWDPRHHDYANTAKGVFERSEMQRLLTGEVNAAAEGLFEAGVKEVTINDAHGAGRTILPEALISGVKLGKGRDRPSWLIGLSRSQEALVQVGMHSKTGTPGGCLAHSMSRNIVYRVNGREIGEMGIAACLAGQVGIPWIFTSGDLHACVESEEWVPGIVTAPVKEGLGEECAIHLAPVDARALIRERVQEAIEKIDHFSPVTVTSPVELTITREDPWPANINPLAERLDPFTVRYVGDTFWSAFYAMRNLPDLPLPE